MKLICKILKHRWVVSTWVVRGFGITYTITCLRCGVRQW